MTGEVKGRLTVLEHVGSDKHGKRQWLCICECGNKLIVVTGDLNSGHTKSCGCLHKDSIHNKYKEGLLGQTFERLTVTSLANKDNQAMNWNCQCECGGSTIASTGSLNSGHTKSCGCLQVDMASGENHWKWKGGITSEHLRIRTSQAYKVWRIDVFERDKFTCQKCDDIGGTLNAHHILSFAKYEDARLKVSNGTTLCKSCHTKFHSTYTKTSFTENDYLEFIGDKE